jgi:arsenite-transporting ATPase
MTRVGRPMLEKVLGIPIPRDEVFAAAERLLDRLSDVHRLLSDPDRTSVRITLALDKLSVAEARRSHTYFHLFGYPSDMIIANRVLPPNAGPYFERLREAQQRYLPIVEQEFAPVPVRTVPQFDHEMTGIDQLREIGVALFGDADPTAVHYRGEPYKVSREADGYVLQVELPFTERGELRLSRRSDELVLEVGGWRRTLLLPRALIDAPTNGAKMDNGTLRIHFKAPAAAGKRGGRR